MARQRRVHVALLILAVFVASMGTSCKAKSEEESAADALNRGLQAQAAGRTDEAGAAYQEVLRHDPRNKYAFYNLGLIDQTAGRLDSAENHYRLALSVDADFGPALFNLAGLRVDRGASPEGIQLYRHLISIDPNNAAAHLNLGFALLAMGDREAGVAELQQAGELDPKLRPPKEILNAPSAASARPSMTAPPDVSSDGAPPP